MCCCCLIQIVRHLPPPSSPNHSASSSSPSSIPVSNAAFFARAVRRALPLRLLQMVTVLRHTQSKIAEAAKQAGQPPPSDQLAADTIKQLVEHTWPKLFKANILQIIKDNNKAQTTTTVGKRDK